MRDCPVRGVRLVASGKKVLLLVPPFWDPVCVPLGVSSLKAFAERRGHPVDIFDFNAKPKIFSLQRRYFDLGKRMFPRWTKWNIERNGTEALAVHQILFLNARRRPDYADLVAEALNMAHEDAREFRSRLNVAAFDEIFVELYRLVEESLNALLGRKKYDVVGCSLFNSTWPSTLFILERCKAADPKLRTLVGGPGPMMGIASSAQEISAFFEAHRFIDHYVVGEGEQAFLDILDAPPQERSIIAPAAGASHGKPKRFDELPPPDYGDLDVGRYLQLSASMSRGCPFECSFCAETVFWKGFSRIAPTSAADLLQGLAQRYNRTSFYLCDSLANQVIAPLTRDLIRRGLDYKLDCYLRADPICCDSKRVAEWKKGGLYRARIGMESASQRILDEMVKMTNPDQMSLVLETLSGAGVITSTLWIIGYPGETEDEFNETLRFVREHRSFIYQSDGWLMQYHQVGLAGSNAIGTEGWRSRYSEELTKILKIAPMSAGTDLTPQERFSRLERFVATMDEAAIPNPYGLFQWIDADKRWSELGKQSGWYENVIALNA